MTEAQSWVLIGMFGILTVGGFSLLAVFFDRQLRLTRELILARVDGKIDSLSTKIDTLDKDVQAIATRVFGADQ